MTSIGYCPALLITGVNITEPGKPPRMGTELLNVFFEAAAIPCYPHQGKEVILGLAGQPCRVKAAYQMARVYLEHNHDFIGKLIAKELKKPHPYIDLKNRHRLNPNGLPFAEDPEGLRDVEVLFNSPPGCNAEYLLPSMILAMICMQWQLPSLKGWVVAGTFTSTDWELHGYPNLNYLYLTMAKERQAHTLLLPKANAEQIIKDVKDHNETLEGLGMRVIGCNTMHEMVCWAILKKDPAQVLNTTVQQTDE